MTDYATDPKGYEERLLAKLQPARVRSTLAFAALFQVTHEMLKAMVLDDVMSFYGYTNLGGDVRWFPDGGEVEYQRHVLDLHQNRFTASLLWLQQMEALTADQAARLNAIYDHRHDLTHELAKYLVDPNLEPDFDLFMEALKTLKALSSFWTEVEAGFGTFDDYPDLDLDEVKNGRMLLIELCIGAYGDGLTDADI